MSQEIDFYCYLVHEEEPTATIKYTIHDDRGGIKLSQMVLDQQKSSIASPIPQGVFKSVSQAVEKMVIDLVRADTGEMEIAPSQYQGLVSTIEREIGKNASTFNIIGDKTKYRGLDLSGFLQQIEGLKKKSLNTNVIILKKYLKNISSSIRNHSTAMAYSA
ncbi:MAG TPA: hypothetical protein VD816_05020 [Ohtaekwangia sp.]|nr:hypothetical protein [Ohtaekwangia sp.]